MIKQQTSWWVDTVLFIGFLVAFFLSFTGVELHQWIGVIGGILAAYHLLVHWEWVRAVGKRFSAKRQALGTLKLEGTDQVVTASQAGQLLTLWQAYQSLSNSDTSSQVELEALVKQI